MIAAACALVGALGFYLGFGLDSVWALAWAAPAPLLWLSLGKSPRWQVFAASFVAAAAGQAYLVQVYWGQLPNAVIAILMAGNAALFASAVLIARTLTLCLPPVPGLFAFPALWTAVEALYSRLSPHGSFGAFAYASVGFPASVQIASVFGLFAVTFTMCLFANALAQFAHGRRGPGLVGLAICAAVLGFGAVRLAMPQGPEMTVAAVSDWDARERGQDHLDRGLSDAAAATFATAARTEAEHGAELIVVPETALAFSPAWKEPLFAPFSALAREKAVTVVVGGMQVRPWRNVALTFSPDGSVTEYDKRHLLPPGENKFTPGPRAGVLGAGRAVAICKDMDFERTLRLDARDADIRILAVPANDFVKDGWMHARMAILRGVENGFAVVRAAFNGMETISDSRGRIVAQASTVGPGMTTLRARVPLGPGATIYTRIGDVFAWLCLAATLALTIRAFWRPSPAPAQRDAVAVPSQSS